LKRVFVFLVIFTLVAGLIAAAFIVNNILLGESSETLPFHVGVTFCGNTTAEAKLLIDKVKGYTNLFVLQSGPLQQDIDAITEICDYAADAGLDFIVYFGSYEKNQEAVGSFLEIAEQRWTNQFLGLYYGDETGGKMLDANSVTLQDPNTGDKIIKQSSVSVGVIKADGTRIDYTEFGQIFIEAPDETAIFYHPNGVIFVILSNGTSFKYELNGTITRQDPSGELSTVENNGNLPQVESYETVLNARPFQNYEETAEIFTGHIQSTIEWMSNQSITVFTSDYGLYWFDYLGGYDVVLAQFGWNHTTAQDIALVRGAANLQGKSWGAIITWKYTEAPYLASGEEIYSQMRTAYECGAEYVVLFNYAEDMGAYGTLQEEHFEALERFWKEVVQNSEVVHGRIDAEAVLVLPSNYGWGMRRPDDTIWGLWGADEKSPQIWAQLQDSLEAHGLRLDIVYDDPQYPVTGKYNQIYYWNQTG
jgi:hypothetical protein